MEVAFSPVKQKALELQLSIDQPEKIKNNQEFREKLQKLKPDAIIVVGYGRIIPQWMIDLPRLGNINLHASLLPKYRGAAPVQWAIANGESITGITTMRIDAGLDTGDILLQKEFPIGPQETALTLSPELAEAGADLMVDTLWQLEAGMLQPRAQRDSEATLGPLLKKGDGRIDFRRSAEEIFNRLRGFQPWPGAFTVFRDKVVNVWQAKPLNREIPAGQLFLEKDRLLVGCGNNSALELLEVQLEGKKRMPVHDFIHGFHPRNGEELGG